MRLTKLSEPLIEEHMKKLPNWTRHDDALTKTYQFKDFTHALQFVNQVGGTAEAVNHHPDIDIRYNKVTLTLTTHDSQGITQNDIELAAASDDFADAVAG